MSRNVPKLRFKEFEDQWKERKLGEFLTESRILGSTGSKAQKLTVKLWAKGIVPKREWYEGSDNTKYYTRREGQLMYGKLDFLNCAFGIVPKELDGYESTVDAPAFDIKGINSYFLFNKIIQKNFYKKYGDIADGSRKAKRIHTDTFLDMAIKCPSLKEQEKIADFFIRLDNLIEEQDGEISDLELYKKGMMQKIFSQEIRFKDESGCDYPEWEEQKLGDIGIFLKGNGIAKSDLTHAGRECILYGELYTKYGEVIKEIKSRTNINIKNPSLSKINDIIIPSSGETAIDIATASCVMKNDILLGGDLNIVRLNNDNGIFLSYQLNNVKRKEISKIAQGASVVHIYNEQLKKIKVNIPSLEEQIKIADYLYNIDKIIEEEKKNLDDLKEMKKGLLQQIFI